MKHEQTNKEYWLAENTGFTYTGGDPANASWFDDGHKYKSMDEAIAANQEKMYKHGRDYTKHINFRVRLVYITIDSYIHNQYDDLVIFRENHGTKTT